MSLDERLAPGRAKADAAWARTLNALDRRGGDAPHLRARPAWAPEHAREWPPVQPIEDDWLDQLDEARREREDAWWEERQP